MKLLITGGGGFLGKHLLKELKQYDFDIYAPTSREVNLLNKTELGNAFDWFRPETCLHMAALCGGLEFNKNNPAELIHQNTDMGSNVFAACKQYGCTNIFTLGSVCSYPMNCPIPMKEDDIWNGEPEKTNSYYSQSKRFLLSMGNAYRDQYKFTGAHLIPVNMFGPEDCFDKNRSHVIAALIKKMLEAKRDNLKEVKLFGSGEASREFLFVKDACIAIRMALISKLDTDLPINLGTGKSILIKDLAVLIKELTEFKGELFFDGTVGDGQMRRQLDVSRAKQFLNWEAKTSLRDGLIQTIEWYKENYIE